MLIAFSITCGVLSMVLGAVAIWQDLQKWRRKRKFRSLIRKAKKRVAAMPDEPEVMDESKMWSMSYVVHAETKEEADRLWDLAFDTLCEATSNGREDLGHDCSVITAGLRPLVEDD